MKLTMQDIEDNKLLQSAKFSIGDIITNRIVIIRVESVRITIMPNYKRGIIYTGRILNKNFSEKKTSIKTGNIYESPSIKKLL